MNTDALRNEPASMMLIDRVKPEKVDEHEAWSAGVLGDARRFAGILGVDVIRPADNAQPEYMTLVKFDTCYNSKRWRESPSLATWPRVLPDLLFDDSHRRGRST